MLDWENLFKRYVWDDRTTPYLIPVHRLKRQQADYEILAYSVFIGVLFGVVSITALTDVGPQGRSPNMSLYALSVTFASVIFGYSKHYHAALYLSAAPLARLPRVLWASLRPSSVRYTTRSSRSDPVTVVLTSRHHHRSMLLHPAGG